MNKIFLIIPVYNEKKNIQKLFMKIKKLKIKFDILYIEGNSKMELVHIFISLFTILKLRLKT